MKTFRERLSGHCLLVLTIAIVGAWCCDVARGQAGDATSPTPNVTPLPKANESVDVVAVIQMNSPNYIVPPTFREPFDLDEFIEEQRQLVSSRRVLSNAVASTMKTLPDMFRDKADPVAFLAEHMDTSMISKRLMQVRMIGDDVSSEERLKLLEAVIESYLTFHKDRQGGDCLSLIRLLESERDRRKELLRHQHEKLKQAGDDNSIDAELRRRELDISIAIYEKIVTRIEELRINSEAPSSILVVHDPEIRKPRARRE